jgi:hypothetical protein
MRLDRQCSSDSDGRLAKTCDSVADVALLSRMMRTAAITGRADSVNAWFAGRQGGRWAEQTAATVLPKAAPRVRRTTLAVATPRAAHRAETLRELTELHRRGVVTDAEFEGFRARLQI